MRDLFKELSKDKNKISMSVGIVAVIMVCLVTTVCLACNTSNREKANNVKSVIEADKKCTNTNPQTIASQEKNSTDLIISEQDTLASDINNVISNEGRDNVTSDKTTGKEALTENSETKQSKDSINKELEESSELKEEKATSNNTSNSNCNTREYQNSTISNSNSDTLDCQKQIQGKSDCNTSNNSNSILRNSNENTSNCQNQVSGNANCNTSDCQNQVSSDANCNTSDCQNQISGNANCNTSDYLNSLLNNFNCNTSDCQNQISSNMNTNCPSSNIKIITPGNSNCSISDYLGLISGDDNENSSGVTERNNINNGSQTGTENSNNGHTSQNRTSQNEGTQSGNDKASNTTSVPYSDYVDEVIRLVNVERNKAGLPSLTKNSKACTVANVRANEIITLFDHTRPNGKDCFSVLSEYNITYRTAGENIAMGQTSPAQVVESWMNSPGHRANILNSSFTQIGVGVVYSGGRYYWAQMFLG